MIGIWTKVRIGLIGVGFLALAVTISRRAYQLQVRESEQLRGWAENNYLREVEIPPKRGRILDRNGEELAATADLDSVYCNPRQLPDRHETVRRLAKALHLDPVDLGKSLDNKSMQYFAWLKRRVTPEESAAVAALQVPGVGTRKEPRRVYPGAELAATIIGHAGMDGKGLDGVELGFDAYLRGTGMGVLGIRDRLGRELLEDGMVDSSAVAGKDIKLTLDPHLTSTTEKVLVETVRKHNAKAGMAVMMNPRTGEILAMANVPTYNPNDPSDLAKSGARNRIVTDVFEPGSTLKTLTFAAVLDAGKLRPEDRFDCEMGQLKIGKHRIRDDHPKGILTAAEVFKHSSNIGTVKIARRIGKEALWSALDRFGLGQLTHTGLPGERRGTLRSADQWRELDFVTHAFGQGVTVTPLQLTAAFSAIAAYGIYRPPILAKSAIGHDGHEEPIVRPPEARGEKRIMSEAAARTLLTIMEGVTLDGTAKAAYIPGYPVAGKTGTAQKVSGGRYDPNKYLASFVGIVPANDPRLVLAVLVDEPQGIHYGGVICAPAFKEIAEKALVYLGVPPSMPIVAAGKNKGSRTTGKGTAGAPPTEDVSDSPDYEESPIPLVEETEEDGSDTLARESSLVDHVTLPDFSGMSMGEAIQIAHNFGIELVPAGSGVAKNQLPKPGKVPRGTPCQVTFRP